mgnify:FL=1
MKIAFHTLGCKVNQYETEGLKENFKKAGHETVPDTEFADVYVINTCTVTNLADRKSRQFIRRARAINPDAAIAVTGCYVQVSPEEVAAIEGVDIIAGTNEKSAMVALVEEYIRKGSKIRQVKSYEELDTYEETGTITSMESRTRAYIKIQEGCDRFCSYCIIPFARGRVRSRKPSEIIKEAANLIEAGFKELILTGINAALYGTEKGFVCDIDNPDIKELYGIEIIIYLLDRMPGDFRIRLSSLEPTAVNSDYVKRLLEYDRLCHHLHLSIQSGSDSVICAMNRNYTRRDYLDIVKVLRDKDPHYGITTDIIVGFPGETDEDFADSMNMVREADFLRVHAFQYSKRKGTAAAVMENQIEPQVKKSRSAALIAEADRVSKEFMTACTGEIRQVLFEETDKDKITGYTDNYIKVYAQADERFLNTLRDVKITGIMYDGVSCEIIEEDLQ